MRWGENSEVIVGYLYHHQRRSRFDKTLGKKETLETCVLAAYTERHSPGMCSSSQVSFQVQRPQEQGTQTACCLHGAYIYFQLEMGKMQRPNDL